MALGLLKLLTDEIIFKKQKKAKSLTNKVLKILLFYCTGKVVNIYIIYVDWTSGESSLRFLISGSWSCGNSLPTLHSYHKRKNFDQGCFFIHLRFCLYVVCLTSTLQHSLHRWSSCIVYIAT